MIKRIRFYAYLLPTLIATITLITILLGGATLHFLEARLVASAGQSLTLAAVDIADKLDMLLAEGYGDVQMMAHASTFQEQHEAVMTGFLEWMISAYPVYKWLGVTNAAGYIVAATDPASVGKDRSGREWFQAVRDHPGVHIRDAKASEDSGGVLAVAFTAPIRGRRGAFLGAITSRIPLSVLENVFIETTNVLRDQWGMAARIEYLFLNDAGDLIADSLLREEGGANLKRLKVSSANLFDSALPGFVEELHARRNVAVVTGYARMKGMEGSKSLKWGVLVRVDRGDILVQVRAIMWKIGAAGIGMMLPLVGILLWSTTGLTRSWETADEERNRAQAAERKFHTLVEMAPNAIVMTDAEGLVVLTNRQADQLFGYPPDGLLGKNLHELVHHSRKDGSPYPLGECLLHGAFQSGQEMQLDDEMFWRHDGSAFPAEVASRPVYEAGLLKGIMITVADITVRRKVQQELLAAKELADATARAKGEFLATMSHEIRTPMNGVIGMTGLLLDTELRPDQREFAETVRSCGEHLLTVINDILDFSKIEAGKINIEVIDFDLRTAVNEIVDLLAERAFSKGVNLACLFHAEVPTALRGDPERLRQILLNLLGNAIKFTERGDVVLSVSLLDHIGTHVTVRFEVQDTGIGISLDAQGRLFQSFSQADSSTTRKFGGTGLGLAICKQLTELMGGQIGVNSQPGEGSIFWFTVSLEMQPKATASARAMASRDLQGLRLCIVGDNPINLRIMKLYAERWGVACFIAEDGQQALTLLRETAAGGQACDLAIIDMQLPGMNGLELATTIKADPVLSPTRLVLLTSQGRRGDAKAAQAAGYAGYLSKPVHAPQLYACLTAVLDSPAQANASEDHSAGKTEQSELVTRHSLAEKQAQATTKILLAEDNVVNQTLAIRMLEKLGYRVDLATNGLEVLDALARIPYSAVLMDCQMPNMDGFEATREIRRREAIGTGQEAVKGGQTSRLTALASRHIPIIAMTANVMQEDRDRCLAVGMDDYVSKPMQSKMLAAVLARWIGASVSISDATDHGPMQTASGSTAA